MRDIAARLDVSVMTVSRALRNAAGVNQSTRKQVLEMAQRLGYRPDPALAVLNAYRHNRRQRVIHEQVAFVTNFPTPNHWKRVPTFRRYFEGASRRADALGYTVSPFWLGDPNLTPRRASTILRDRGIRGLLVGPLAKGDTSLELEWDWFSTVALGRSLVSPGLTTASTNHLQVGELGWTEAVRLGYTRIGLVLSEYEDVRTLGGLRAAVLLQQSRARLPAIPVHLSSGNDPAGVASWVMREKPDVLLSPEQTLYEALEPALRRKVAFIHLNADPESPVAGVDQGHDEVGDHAMALLHLKLSQRLTGVPARRDILLIAGQWHAGIPSAPGKSDSREPDAAVTRASGPNGDARDR